MNWTVWMYCLRTRCQNEHEGLKKPQINAAITDSRPVHPVSNKRERNRWRKQEQIDGESARSRASKLSVITWTHTTLFLFPLSFSFCFSPSYFPFTRSFLSCIATLRAKSFRRDSLLPTENLLHRREERDRLDSLLRHFFLSSNYIQPWATRWVCRAPLAMGSPSHTPTPTPCQASLCSTVFFCCGFDPSELCKKVKHDTRVLCAYLKKIYCLIAYWTSAEYKTSFVNICQKFCYDSTAAAAVIKLLSK